MIKKFLIILLVMAMALCTSACKDESVKNEDSNKNTQSGLLKYEHDEFEICGLWAPRQMTEEAFLQYKEAGFNVFSFTNHDELPRNSDTQYYVGSNRTKEALEICKKIGIDVYLAYGATWYNRANEGDEYFDNAPFSTHDYYGEYKDIIKGVHIFDEPNKETMTALSDTALIDDFKKIYPNAKYMINLIPETAITSRNYENYTEMLEHYGNDIMSKFEKPYICVDCYLCSKHDIVGINILNNYNQIANTAKKYKAETTFILQSSTGNEFWDEVSKSDMRLQAYLALAFGADNLQYYCYSVPDDIPYNHCMLEKDNKTPNEMYYYVKDINAEIQSFASAVLAYDWQQTIGLSGIEKQTYRVTGIEFDDNFERVEFRDAKHFVEAYGTHDLVVSQFSSEKYGEAYMLVNFSDDHQAVNKLQMEFKDCKALALYGGEDYSGEPSIITPNENGEYVIEFAYGEGAFVVPVL